MFHWEPIVKCIPSTSFQNYWYYFYRYYLSQARPIAKTAISEGADKKGAAAAEDDSKVYVNMISTQVSRISWWKTWLAKWLIYKLKFLCKKNNLNNYLFRLSTDLSTWETLIVW